MHDLDHRTFRYSFFLKKQSVNADFTGVSFIEDAARPDFNVRRRAAECNLKVQVTWLLEQLPWSSG